MTTLNRLMTLIASNRGRDMQFENYYGSLVRNRIDGGPTAAEARRDFEPVRRLIDRAVIY